MSTVSSTSQPGMRPPDPTFVIIGAQKSATRWLRTNLGEHPDIYTPSAELHFWNSARRVRASNGMEWYRGKFGGWKGEPILGEATPGYMIWRHDPRAVASRMRCALPDARLIAILRNPIDRAYSAMLHHIRRRRLPPGSRLVDVVRERTPSHKDRLCVAAGGWYAQCLEPFKDAFGDQLLVLLHDDVITDPAGVYDAALRHVGADPGFVPPSLDRIVYSNRNRRTNRRYELTQEDRVALWPFFRYDVGRLEEMFGLDLTHWKPGAPRAEIASSTIANAGS